MSAADLYQSLDALRARRDSARQLGAAAPILLEALERLLSLHTTTFTASQDHPSVVAARRAIAFAKGQL